MGLLSKNHAVDKGGSVEVRASSELRLEHIQTRRSLAIRKMHIRHLQYLQIPSFPKPQPPLLWLWLLLLLIGSQAADRKQNETEQQHYLNVG
jgi:hypothetical protein